ncbi:MAG TPA: tetratricopeptide repeat protein, partial [Elusimicrobiota bacterium]|nr:tetratricopeptide repeat protein [Elusimicrobiota bacterium]
LAAALADNPKDTAALLELGLLYAENERWEKSAEAFDRLLALEPDNAAALNDRANLYLIAKDAAKARELYEKAAAADAKDSGIQLNIVRAAKTAGDKTAAKAAFNKALEIAPELKKTYTTWEEASEW